MAHSTACSADHTLSVPHAQHTEGVAHLIPSPPNSQHTTEYTENTAECIAPHAPHSEHIAQYTEATELQVLSHYMLGTPDIQCAIGIVG